MPQYTETILLSCSHTLLIMALGAVKNLWEYLLLLSFHHSASNKDRDNIRQNDDQLKVKDLLRRGFHGAYVP